MSATGVSAASAVLATLTITATRGIDFSTFLPMETGAQRAPAQRCGLAASTPARADHTTSQHTGPFPPFSHARKHGRVSHKGGQGPRLLHGSSKVGLTAAPQPHRSLYYTDGMLRWP